MMPTVTNAQTTTRTLSDRRNILAIPPTTTTTPLYTPRLGVTVLWRILHTLMVTWTRRHSVESRCIHLDYPRQETPIDRCVRIDPYLYTRSLSG
jgi:hypothetical protein